MIKVFTNILFSIVLLTCYACQKKELLATMEALPNDAKGNIIIDPSAQGEENIAVDISLSNIPKNANCNLVASSKFTEQIIPIKKDINPFKTLVNSHNISGDIWMGCFCNGKLLSQNSIYILPGLGKDKMEAFNGPKSLLSYDDVSSMLVVIPKDQYGNPVAAGTPVNFVKQYPNQININNSAPTNNLVAYKITESIGKSGKILLGASADQAFMSEQEILIQASLPQKIFIETLEVHPNADSRQNIQLATLPILDVNGNPVADGTKINFVVLDERGKYAQYDSFTINGIAKVLIQNPSRASRWQIIATLYGSVFSNTLNFNFASFIKDYDLSYNKDKSLIVAGPLSTTLGQLAADGTVGKLIYLNTKGIKTSMTEESLDGYIEFKFPKDLMKGVKTGTIDIGGIKNQIQFD